MSSGVQSQSVDVGSSSSASAATASNRSNKPPEQMTSFGFLNDADDEQESTFDLGSLLLRVRNAFVPGEQPQQSSTVATHGSSTSQTASPEVTIDDGYINSGGAIRKSSSGNAAPLSQQQPRKSSGRLTGLAQDASNGNATGSASASAAMPATKTSIQSVPSRKNSRANSAVSKTTASSNLMRNIKLPYSLASSSFAPAVTSTAAAHAIAPQRFQSITPETLRNGASGGDQDGDEDGEDVLTALMRKSGVDQSRRKTDAGFSSIPGFPLSKDTLADDTRSIHSSSSRMLRSETYSTNEAQLVTAQPHLYNAADRDVSAGLSASAEAFRRMRGEGTVLSRDLWMPDETVKECRECQSFFTPFRRKHHCRICGLVFCSRCASNIVSGRRFGLDKTEIRVCNFCLRVLSEYERAGQHAIRDGSAHPAMVGGPPSSPHRMATSYARKRTESNGLGARPDKKLISAPLEAQLQSPQPQFAANQLFSHPRGAAGSSLSVAQGLPRMDSLQDMLLELEENERSHSRKAPLVSSIEGTPPRSTKGSSEVGEDENRDHDDDHVPFRVKLSEEDRIPAMEDDAPQSLSPDTRQYFNKAVEMTASSSSSKKHKSNDETGPSKMNRGNRDARSKLLVGDSGFLDARERGVSGAALRAVRKSKLRAREQNQAGDDSLSHQANSGAGGISRAALFPKASIARRTSLTSTMTTHSDNLNLMSEEHLSALLTQTLERSHMEPVQQWQKILEPLILKVVKHINPRPRTGESMDIRQYIKFKRIPGGDAGESKYVDGFVLTKQVATKKMARSLPLSNPRVMIVAFPIDFHRADEQFMSLQPVLAQEHEYTRILVARLLQLRPNVLVVKDTVSRLALEMLEEAGVVVVWSVKTSAVYAISRCCQADIITSVERLALEPRLGRCAVFGVETFQHASSSQCRKSLMRFQTAGHARSLGCSIILRGANLQTLGTLKGIASLLVYAAHNLRLEEQLNRDEGAQLQLEKMRQHAQRGSTILCPGVCDKEHDELWERILEALKPFEMSILSASISINIPPPYQLMKMKETHRRLKCLQQDCSGESNKIVELRSDEEKSTLELLKSSSSDNGVDEKESSSKESEKSSNLPALEDVMPKPSQLQAEYSKALVDHQLFLKEWSTLAQIDMSASLRKINILWTLISTATHKPCLGPRLLSFTFYGPQDETLGQFLERTCEESSMICSAKGCGRPRGVHYSSFVHNETRVQVVSERFVCPIPGQESRLLMWSYCKRCERATPVTPVSNETWSLSFAKYLELHFYDGHKFTTLCDHDYYSDFVRFFSLQNLAIRFHRDRDFVVRDVVLPPMHLLPRPDVDYKLKVESAKALQDRMDAYWNSVQERLLALRKELSLSAHFAGQLETAIQSAKDDESELKALLINTCRSSDQTDILALNAVRNRLQAFVVRWDQFFQEFERTALPSERDLRRLTTHHLSRIFQDRDSSASGTERVVDALGLSPAHEIDEATATAPSQPVVASESTDAALSESTTSTEAKASVVKGLKDAFEAASLGSSDGLSSSIGRRVRSDTQTSEASLLAPSKRREGIAEQSLTTLALGGMSDSDTLAPTDTVRRPTFRRGKTSDEVRTLKANTEKGAKLTSPAGKVVPLPAGPQVPSVGLASRKASYSAIARRGPPSSYRPPKSLVNNTVSSGLDTESDGGGATSAGSGISSIRRKLSISQRRGRMQALDAAKDGGVPTSAAALGGAKKSPNSTTRIPAPINNRSSRVSTIARRFDNLQREAERERERQRLVRARRARPVGASQTTVQVYRSLKDAVRDDDESELSGNESQHGDEAEDEDDSETGETRIGKGRARVTRVRRKAGQREPVGGSTIRANDTIKATVLSQLEARSRTNEEQDEGQDEDNTATIKGRLQVPTIAMESSESSPERERHFARASGSSAVSKGDAIASSAGPQGPENTGMELTMSSLLSGTLPASWRASLLPAADNDSQESRGSLLKTISSLWAKGTLNLPVIELPVRSTEHLFSDSPLVVLREDEPSSLIAFTLNSSTYASRLESLRETHAPMKGKTEAETRSMKSLASNLDEKMVEEIDHGAVPDAVPCSSEEVEAALRQAEGTHLSFQFSSGDSRFSIRVLFTEQFDALRRACDCGQTFVQSLSRCWNWSDCTGGKSGAAMMKTLDDRFIIKQLSRAEMDAFASNAGAYFRFLADVINQDRPTTLAKIYGVYRLTIRNAQTGKSIKLDCAITENVFANAKMAQIFDLKGALRNRFVQPNGQSTQVLLDGNLITTKTPIYLREGSKHILRRALYHDSLFLSNCDVMDYSLVVGVCEGTAELRVGIIDFIRTFTFGKKAESFLKEAVGGHGSEAPTIVDPKQYRARFLAFLDSVLLLSPDHWLSEEEEARRSAKMHLGSTTAGAAAGGIAGGTSMIHSVGVVQPNVAMLGGALSAGVVMI